jgi:hypothetical protein
LVRRVLPSILRAFQTRIVQIELPRVGCYDARSGGWFRPHRDNTTPFTAHCQFALSLNLNPTHEYRGMLAEQKVRGLSGIRMRLVALLLPASQFCDLAEMALTIV